MFVMKWSSFLCQADGDRLWTWDYRGGAFRQFSVRHFGLLKVAAVILMFC